MFIADLLQKCHFPTVLTDPLIPLIFKELSLEIDQDRVFHRVTMLLSEEVSILSERPHFDQRQQ